MIAAERTLYIRQADGDTPVLVRVEVPVADRGAWTCRFTIGWPDEPANGYATAYDGIQALLFAMERIAILMYVSPYHQARTLFLQEPGEGYGFPLPRNSRELAIGLDKNV